MVFSDGTDGIRVHHRDRADVIVEFDSISGFSSDFVLIVTTGKLRVSFFASLRPRFTTQTSKYATSLCPFMTVILYGNWNVM